MGQADARVASHADLEAVTDTLWRAFTDDPVWRWAFPEHDPLRTWWRFLVRSAIPHGWVWVSGDFAAVSVWIPPGEPELSADEEAQVEGLMGELAGARSPEVLELLERFERAHPTDRAHFYLSLLGTAPQARGRGIGTQLLADNLARIDARQMPAYLESSNPANDARYERLGFAPAGSFTTPGGAHRLTTMWRPAAAPTG